MLWAARGVRDKVRPEVRVVQVEGVVALVRDEAGLGEDVALGLSHHALVAHDPRRPLEDLGGGGSPG